MRTYVTISGDTFDKIALNQLGSEYLLPFLLRENQKYRNVLIFSANVSLNIPDVEIDEYENVPEWMIDENNNSESEQEIYASSEDS